MRLFHRNYEFPPKTPEMQLIFLGTIIDKFSNLYSDQNGDLRARCVDVSTQFCEFLSRYPFDCIKVVREVISIKSKYGKITQEHGWVEVEIGKKWYVVDITGVVQFKLKEPFYPKWQYRSVLKQALIKREKERRGGRENGRFSHRLSNSKSHKFKLQRRKLSIKGKRIHNSS